MPLLIPGTTPIPPHQWFDPEAYADVPDGTLILQGQVDSAPAGTFRGVEGDVEYLLDERTGFAHWSSDYFRGRFVRMRVVKRAGKIVIEPMPIEPIPERKIRLQPMAFPGAKPDDILLEGEVKLLPAADGLMKMGYIERDGIAYYHEGLVQAIGRRMRVTYVNAAQFKVEEVTSDK